MRRIKHVKKDADVVPWGGIGSNNKYQAFRARSVELGGAGWKPAE